MTASAGLGLPAGLPEDLDALHRLDLLLRVAIAGCAHLETAEGPALRAGVVIDDGEPILLLRVEDRP